MSLSLSQTSAPQKRKLDSEELDLYTPNIRNDLTISDDHRTTMKPPKLRRILTKYSKDKLLETSFSDTLEPSLLQSVTESHSTLESLDTIIDHYRKISFRILRLNLLHRDVTAQTDKTAHTIGDIYDINGEEDVLAWPLNVPPKAPVVIPPKPRATDIPIQPTRVLRSSVRNSSSPFSSKSSTPIPLQAPAVVIPVTTIPEVSVPLETPPLPLPPPPSDPVSAPAVVAVKTEYDADQAIPPYKRLPSRGDCVQKRIAKLQADPWSDPSKLTPKSVYCIGCQKSVCLDKRFDYYPGFWETHKRRCPFVQSGKLRQTKAIDQVNSA
ncbi:hypothetical protein C8R42DRAFT_660641 [Lentinula raphanica]|nr:hypothetical protein C8R42DRAFT_660641 [Lentinula raphanica]